MKFSVRNIFFTIFILLLSPMVFAIEEIPLQTDNNNLKMEIFEENQEDEISEEEEYQDISSKPLKNNVYEKGLKEKLKDVYELEVSDNDHQEFLFNNILTKKFENGPLDNIGVWGVWRGALNIDMFKHNTNTTVNYNILESRLHGNFKNKKTSFIITTRFVPQNEFGFMQNLFADFFIRHKINKNTTITMGNSRTHTGQEGAKTELLLPLYAYSQISRNFGNIRKLGVRINGDYKLIDYDIGGYSSGTYFREYFPGAEFNGWVNVKPFGNKSKKYGKLVIGGGYNGGHNRIDYSILSGYVGYNYKKLWTNFETAIADGYNGSKGISSNGACGFAYTLGWKFTPHIQLIGRIDQFDPNRQKSHDLQREYTIGLNWFIKGQAMKVVFNYVFCDNQSKPNSHKLILATQILL